MSLATTLLHKKAVPWWLSGPALLLFTVLLLVPLALSTGLVLLLPTPPLRRVAWWLPHLQRPCPPNTHLLSAVNGEPLAGLPRYPASVLKRQGRLMRPFSWGLLLEVAW